ncbi:MAG: hypothetical protein ACYS26_15235 [Planctomycetota bacterium]|jgi:hypothetical protein
MRFERAPADASVDELRELMGKACVYNEYALDALITESEFDSPELPMASCGEWRPSNMESGVARMVTLQYQPAAAPFVDLLDSIWPQARGIPVVRWEDYRAPVLTAYLTPDHGWRLHEDVEGTYGGEFNAAFAQLWKIWKERKRGGCSPNRLSVGSTKP